MPAGYSKRSLIDKLGIKPKSRLSIIAAPNGYEKTLGPMPEGTIVSSKPTRNLDFIQAFFLETSTLTRQFPALKKGLAQNGALWISWPKKAAKMATDLDENIVREIGLKNGLVDIKVCAIDEVWSGLKFVYRKQDRSS